jgi:FMN phosphatase YigB (HAD superfamily)
MAPRRHILIAMDAFGTIFSPKNPIGEQYVAVAAKLGIPGLRSEDIHKSFYSSFKHMGKEFPNYGKKAGLNTELWWKAVIEQTFLPHITEQQKQKLPNLISTIITRFWSDDGYALHDDAFRFVQEVKSYRMKHQADGFVFFGVLSNSDTRLPDILKSFQYKVSNLKPNSNATKQTLNLKDVDFEFVVLSYDVGHEKPAKEIFDATESLVRERLMPKDEANNELLKLYVGDEMEKDGIGALGAGWHPVVVDRSDTSLPVFEGIANFIDRLEDVNAQKHHVVLQVSSLSSQVS